MIVQSHKIS